MKRILILGGTSEGRELAEYAAFLSVPTLVSVVSPYGKALLGESESGISYSDSSVKVRCGALDREEMEKLFKEEQFTLVLDATHPYASQVTELAERLCEECGIAYARVVRESTAENGAVCTVDSIEKAALFLERQEGNVLLTTGSKELEPFLRSKRLSERIFARVLPDVEVIRKCQALGLRGSHILAMQGPFSVALNQAMLEQVQAKWMVTKDSGSRGGLEEKLEAARGCGVSVVLIGRPVQEKGLTLSQAKERIKTFQTKPVRRLVLVGTGMGAGNQLTQEVIRELERCDVLFGAPRLISDVGPRFAATKVAEYQPDPIKEWLDRNPEVRHAGVLYSGDTGFFSGGRRMAGEAALWKGWEISVFPGISSLSCLCARFALSWEGITVASAHGRECDIVNLLQKRARIFLLLDHKRNLSYICQTLCKAGLKETTVLAGIRMGYPDEKLIRGKAFELCEEETQDLTAVLLEREEKAHEG